MRHVELYAARHGSVPQLFHRKVRVRRKFVGVLHTRTLSSQWLAMRALRTVQAAHRRFLHCCFVFVRASKCDFNEGGRAIFIYMADADELLRQWKRLDERTWSCSGKAMAKKLAVLSCTKLWSLLTLASSIHIGPPTSRFTGTYFEFAPILLSQHRDIMNASNLLYSF